MKGITTHTDPEHRIGFFECVREGEDILGISICVRNIFKKICNDSNSTFLEIYKYMFT